MPLSVHDQAPPDRLAVVTRTETPADYASIVEPFTRVLRAPVETGNSVLWF